MPAIQIVLLVLVGGGLVLFAVSNLSPVLPLVFLGMKTLALPISAWIGLAIAAGAFTSFFLQFLNYLQPSSSTRNLEAPDEVPRRSTAFRREPLESPEPEPQKAQNTPPPPEPPKTSSKKVTSDWEEPSSEDWDFEQEPAASTANPQAFEREFSRDIPPSDRTSYEAPQEPKTSSQDGSVYSYSYRDTNQQDSGVGKTDVIYDANYRVITPPYQKPPEPEEDEEDWGFEDDEDFDFNDEPENNPKRR
ncbi:MAG: LapA family protein [Cyanobacteriota bacterium]